MNRQQLHPENNGSSKDKYVCKNNYAVCGVLVHALPARAVAVAERLSAIAGVEVHNISAQGKLVVTAETLCGDSELLDQLTRISNTCDVLNTSLIYNEHDPTAQTGENLEDAS